MSKQVQTKKAVKTALDSDVEDLLNELVKDDDRLRSARKQATVFGVTDDGIGEQAVQIYRQALKPD